MSSDNVVGFLRLLSSSPPLVDRLKALPKHRVLAESAKLGYRFTENEFDALVWGLEIKLARLRGEPFDGQFTLWRTMWGTTYLEYLAADLFPSFRETGLLP